MRTPNPLPTLEKGIAAPVRPPRGRRENYAKHAFARMSPGDSVFPLTKNGAANFRNLAWRHKWKSTQQKMPDGKYRVWRLE